jgi:acetyl esterase/lipase
VVLLHGARGIRADMVSLAQPLSERGLIVVNVQWATDLGHMLESMADAPCAVAYAYEHASEWNGDPDRIIVIGHSAGVNAAMLAALAPEQMVQCENRENSKVWAVIGVAGDPSNATEGGILWNWMKDTRPEVLPAIDTYNYFGKNPDLKVRFVNSLGDGTIEIERVERFADDMGAAGYDVEFLQVEGAGHLALWPEEVLQIVDQLVSQP